MFKLEIRNAANELVSNTDHETLALALAEFAGWKPAADRTQEKLTYNINGQVSVDCACKKIMESRNRTLSLGLSCSYSKSVEETAQLSEPIPVVLKAPQICMLLGTMLDAEALVSIQVTDTEMVVF